VVLLEVGNRADELCSPLPEDVSAPDPVGIAVDVMLGTGYGADVNELDGGMPDMDELGELVPVGSTSVVELPVG